MTEQTQSDRTRQTSIKPLLSVEELVAHLKSKGVAFNLCPEAEAAEYLTKTNNYLRAASYRKLFPVHNQGPRMGCFVHLDFAYLVELSSIDRMLRETLLALAIDVEHFAKVRLLTRVEAEGEDGYAIASRFFDERPKTKGQCSFAQCCTFGCLPRRAGIIP
ncbi:Abi family protein [Collinsella intestinalis]|uniref:Abi family protein n=1 Tax=Collinsella intestinalis TaxID=147207 RepID=UPI00195CB8F2|nr:Abi family protein [Collinsella intestinalis]